VSQDPRKTGHLTITSGEGILLGKPLGSPQLALGVAPHEHAVARHDHDQALIAQQPARAGRRARLQRAADPDARLMSAADGASTRWAAACQAAKAALPFTACAPAAVPAVTRALA